MLLKKSIASMKSGPLKEYYRLKLALLALDSPSEKVNQEGLQALQQMSFDQNHIANDQALYHLGMYFWANKNFNEAKNYWQQFLVKYGAEKALESQLAQVRARLDLIAV